MENEKKTGSCDDIPIHSDFLSIRKAVSYTHLDVYKRQRHIHINSWDQRLQRYFLFEKDLPYVKDLCVFLQSVGYDNTISVEAFDADFPETGAASVSIIKEALHEAEIKNPVSRTAAVSYTHLDVYKRQIVIEPQGA